MFLRSTLRFRDRMEHDCVGFCCCPETPLHGGGKGLENVDQASLPTAAVLEHNVRHFLGYYMIKKFDVLNFLEDTGGAVVYLPRARVKQM